MPLSRVSTIAIGGLVLLVLAGGALEYAVDAKREQAEKAAALTGGESERAPPLLRRHGCTGCHRIPGVAGAHGRVGPPLTDTRARVYIAGTLPNTPENLVNFILQPPAFRRNTAMPVTGIDERGARDVAAYLYAQ